MTAATIRRPIVYLISMSLGAVLLVGFLAMQAARRTELRLAELIQARSEALLLIESSYRTRIEYLRNWISAAKTSKWDRDLGELSSLLERAEKLKLQSPDEFLAFDEVQSRISSDLAKFISGRMNNPEYAPLRDLLGHTRELEKIEIQIDKNRQQYFELAKEWNLLIKGPWAKWSKLTRPELQPAPLFQAERALTGAPSN